MIKDNDILISHRNRHIRTSHYFNYQNILKQLNTYLYGLDREKAELMTYLKITELNNGDFDKILCLTGPKGVGKKSLIYALAKSINRKCIHIKIGMHDRDLSMPTYGKSKIGEIAGKIIHLMNQYRDNDLIFLLDRIDYLSLTFQNKIPHGFKEVLTITHDYALRLKHLEGPLDFRKVLFFATATELSMINQDLLSQLEIIYITGYSDEQKIKITKDWIIPEELKACGLNSNLNLADVTIYEIIRRYTNEIGLSQLSGIIRKLFRGLVFDSALSNREDITEFDVKNLEKYLGHPLFDLRKVRGGNEVGLISTIGRSDGRGVITDLEVLLIEDNRANLILTGNMDNIFREVVMVALSYLQCNHLKFGIQKDFDRRYTIHVNMIPGGVLKSGVSAGLSIILALISSLTNRATRSDISAIGEISLHGKVKKVIGVHEKILGAYRLGLKRVIFPQENIHEIELVPIDIRKNLELIGIDTIEEAVKHTFGKEAFPQK